MILLITQQKEGFLFKLKISNSRFMIISLLYLFYKCRGKHDWVKQVEGEVKKFIKNLIFGRDWDLKSLRLFYDPNPKGKPLDPRSGVGLLNKPSPNCSLAFVTFCRKVIHFYEGLILSIFHTPSCSQVVLSKLFYISMCFSQILWHFWIVKKISTIVVALRNFEKKICTFP